MLRALLFVAGFVLAALGAVSVYRQLTNRTPLAITCADYARTRPSAVWLRVRECEVDYLGAGYREAGGTIEELFFPVRPAGRPRTEPATLVAATSEPAVLAIAQSGIGGGRQPDQEQFLVMMLRIVTALGASREIEGTARTGFFNRLRTRRVLSGLASPLAPEAVVVDVHARPGLLGPAIQAAAGLGLILGGLVLGPRTRTRSKPAVSPADPWPWTDVPAARASPSVQQPAPTSTVHNPVEVAGTFLSEAELPARPSPPPPRLRGLMLLNLGPDSGPQHIEYAAPLGARDEIIHRISEAIKGIQFDGRGRGMVRGGGYAVIVDVGTDDPVQTAIAGADGTGGLDTIRRLLVETGWRGYMPRAGAFAEPNNLEELAAPVKAVR